jgi:hypothetical protein
VVGATGETGVVVVVVTGVVVEVVTGVFIVVGTGVFVAGETDPFVLGGTDGFVAVTGAPPEDSALLLDNILSTSRYVSLSLSRISNNFFIKESTSGSPISIIKL